MKRYVARLKIQGKPFASLLCTGEKDYIVAPPRSSEILDGGGYFDFHFTLHTVNNRVTHKVVDFGNNKEGFGEILDKADKNDFYVSRNKNGSLKDIDITKGKKFLDLDNPGFIGNIFKFGINNVHDKKIKIMDYFCESKRSDEDFDNIIDIEFGKELVDVEIHLNVCKNLIINNINNLLLAYQKIGVEYKEGYVIEDFLGEDCYNFIILVKENKDK